MANHDKMTADSDVTENRIQPPEWLDKAYLEKALREALKLPKLTVTTYHIKPATAPGDNYASLMFRGTLQISKTGTSETEALSVVMKTEPLGKAAELMNKLSVFDKEAKMLQEIVPRISKMLQSYDSSQQPLSAECLYFSKEPANVMILQDLCTNGFANADRMNGLTMVETKLVLESLAKYHAGSLNIIQNSPESLELFKELTWSEQNREVIAPMVNSCMEALVEVSSTWSDFPEEYGQILSKLRKTCLEKIFECWTLDENELNVLMHGDCWTSNFMFSSEEGEVKGFRFVDFQLPCVHSAALDLNYFIFTSPAANLRLNKLDEMLSIYYDTFMATINKLNITLPRKYTLEDLKESFRKKLFFGFVSLLIVYPITIQPSDKAPDVNDFFEEDKCKNSIYQSDKFKQVLSAIMPYFVKEGGL